MKAHLEPLYNNIVKEAQGKQAWKTREAKCSCGIATRQVDGICIPCKNPIIHDWRVKSGRMVA